MECKGWTFSIVTFTFQVILVILFGIFTDYNDYKQPTYAEWEAGAESNAAQYFHPVFQDIHFMIFIGIGLLMTFLKRYNFSAIGYTLFIGALILQWATLMRGWMHHAVHDGPSKIKIDMKTMIEADFAAAGVLITFGVVLGKVSRLQLVIIGVIEVFFYYVNETIIMRFLKITDIGGSIVIHMFAAYFGIALTRMMFNDDIEEENEKEDTVYHSDLSCMIGTVFLWMYWPSFNGALLGPGTQQNRAFINTYYSLAACCVTTFVISPLVNYQKKLSMTHIQNATLAGGVAIGTCADLIVRPWGALLIGMSAGMLSTLAYTYLTPTRLRKLKIHDTCGVHNLHGLPGLLAAIAGVITSSVATFDVYGKDLFSIWSARSPKMNSTLYMEAIAQGIHVDGKGMERDAKVQGEMQAAAIAVTLAISVIGGLLTGLIVRYIDMPKIDELYDDQSYWILPSDAQEARNKKSVQYEATL